jgi:cytochrome c553
MVASAHVAIRTHGPSSVCAPSRGRLEPGDAVVIAIWHGDCWARLGAQDAAIPAFKSVDSMEARVQGCTTCHGQSGQGTSNEYFPRIAGKPAAYLYNQLVAFRDGKRVYPPMNYLVAYLPTPICETSPSTFRSSVRPSKQSSRPAAADGSVSRGATLALSATRASKCRLASHATAPG